MKNSVIKKVLSILFCTLMLTGMGVAACAEGDIRVVDTEALDSWIAQYVSEKGLSDFSVGFCYTATGETWFYNPDQFMYSASMYKVPVSMLLAEQEAAGGINQQTQINGMTVEYLEYTALVNSNNDSGHYIADYVGEGKSAYDTYSGKCADLVQKYAPSLEDSYFPSDYYEYSYYSCRFITEAIETLYNGGDEEFPHIIDYMKQAQPVNYFHLYQENGYEIAQKYGDYQEPNGTQVHHCTGIIYTPNPIVVTVMSKNISYYEQRIGEVAKYLTDYALELDEKLLTATPVPATPEPTAEPEPEPSPEPTAIIETPAPTLKQEPQEESGSKFTIPILMIIAAVVIIVALVIVKLLKKPDGRTKKGQAGRQPARKNENKGYKPKH